jgi:hypothetical protein
VKAFKQSSNFLFYYSANLNEGMVPNFEERVGAMFDELNALGYGEFADTIVYVWSTDYYEYVYGRVRKIMVCL